MFEGIGMGVAVSALAVALYAHTRISAFKPQGAPQAPGREPPQARHKTQGPSGHIFHGQAHHEKPHQPKEPA